MARSMTPISASGLGRTEKLGQQSEMFLLPCRSPDEQPNDGPEMIEPVPEMEAERGE